MEAAGLPSIRQINGPILAQMSQAAQAVYDRWEQDADGMDHDLGSGGICQDIAEAMQGVLDRVGIDAMTIDSNGIGDQHVWLIAKFREGVYEIDIPPSVYETGAGYTWKKIPDVEIRPGHIVINQWSSNPEDFETEFGNY